MRHRVNHTSPRHHAPGLARWLVLLAAGVGLLALAACGSSSSDHSNRAAPGPVDPAEPAFDAARFAADSARIDHPLLPLPAGRSIVFVGENEDGEEVRVEIFVSHRTKEILGVTCAVVVDREYEDGELVEETFDWFAQDSDGNVWYLGEASTEYEDGESVGTDGSWQAGVDGAVAGILIKTSPQVGDTYRQEYLAGEAEDMAEVVALEQEVTLLDGTTYSGAVMTREWTPLEPGAEEFKYYVAGVGLVLVEEDGVPVEELAQSWLDTEIEIDAGDFEDSTVVDNPYLPLVPGTSYHYQVETDEGTETIWVEVLEETRSVLGVECVVVRDRVFLDGELIEDTHDWFAQDEEGNVWYFGETVDNYEDGVLDNHDGAWEAGVDGAVPGIVMLDEPRVGDSYRQEYWAGEAEDLAEVVALATEVILEDGSTFTCLKTRDWNPLEEDSVEFKYYAPGLGLVREADAEEEEVVELQEVVATATLDEVELEVAVDAGEAEAALEISVAAEEALHEFTLFSPRGRELVDAELENAEDLGAEELEFETPDTDLATLEAAYPEGSYRYLAVTTAGEMRMGTATLSYDLPAAASITFPAAGAEAVAPDGLVITWNAIDGAEEVAIEIDATGEGLSLEADLPGNATAFAVPDGWLQEGTEYTVEIAAEGAEGGETETEQRFTTAGAAAEVEEEEEPAAGELDEAELFVVYDANDDEAQLVVETEAEGGLLELEIESLDETVTLEVELEDEGELGLAAILLETAPTALAELMAAFPAGEYAFSAVTAEDEELEGDAALDYSLLAAPEVTFPADGAEDVAAAGLVVTWAPVADAEELVLELEDEESGREFVVELPGDATSFSVPASWLEAATTYQLELAAEADNGNQVESSVEFTTAE